MRTSAAAAGRRARGRLSVTISALLLVAVGAHCQEAPSPSQASGSGAAGAVEPAAGLNYPLYLQSPIQAQQPQQQQSPLMIEPLTAEPRPSGDASITQRSAVGPPPALARPVAGSSKQQPAQPKQRLLSKARKISGYQSAADQLAASNAILPPEVGPKAAKPGECLYDKSYFARFDQCLGRRPLPVVGLPAFKNEDLLAKRGLLERNGCSFILTNGLFKQHQLSRLSVDSDAQCLDNAGKLGLSMQFANATLSYLWTLRCLNRADQLAEDGAQGVHAPAHHQAPPASAGADEPAAAHHSHGQHSAAAAAASDGPGLCVGSSQTFGFVSMQLTNLEAQVELAVDIFKNWRLTNVTVAMVAPAGLPLASAESVDADSADAGPAEGAGSGSTLRDFTFETLDGDELNWRYMHLYQNWARNKLHAHFLEQYRRFLWLSLERCLGESAARLPVKLFNPFSSN